MGNGTISRSAGVPSSASFYGSKGTPDPDSATSRPANADKPSSVVPASLPGSLPPARTQSLFGTVREMVASATGKAKKPLFDSEETKRVMEEALEKATPEERAQHRALEAACKQAQARLAGVDLARANFFTKFMTFATVAVSASVAATLTVATFGAAAPLMALTGLRLVQAIADVGCAAVCWRDAKASVKAGRTIQTLPMGANAMGNLLHKCYRSATGSSMGDPDAKHFAAVGAAGFTVALSAATIITGQWFSPAAMLTAQTCRWAATAVAAVMLMPEGGARKLAQRQSDMQKQASVDFKAAQQLTRELALKLKSEGSDCDPLGVIREIVARGQQEGAHKIPSMAELEALCAKHEAGWPQAPEPDPQEVSRTKTLEKSNAKWQTFARRWIAAVTIANLGRALDGFDRAFIR